MENSPGENTALINGSPPRKGDNSVVLLRNHALSTKMASIVSDLVVEFFTRLDEGSGSLLERVNVTYKVLLILQKQPTVKLGKDKVKETGHIKLVLMVDEAKTLVDWQFYNSFRWVLDTVIERAWMNLRKACRPLPFMAIFLGTNSTVADFLPSKDDSSHRYYASLLQVPPAFTAMNWDIFNEAPRRADSFQRNSLLEELTYFDLPSMTWLSRFGRPLWHAMWMGRQDNPRTNNEAQRIIGLAQYKLHHQNNNEAFENLILDTYHGKTASAKSKEEAILTSSAIVAVLVGLDLDFSAPKLASELVASRLRWAVGCDKDRTILLTSYPSEPVLSEAAFSLFFKEIWDDTNQNILQASKVILDVVKKQIEQGDYDAGGDGELVAKLLCINDGVMC